MSEDITYCMNECNDMKCFRNKKHIKLPIPHSFTFLEGTEDCHKMQKKKKKVIHGGVRMNDIDKSIDFIKSLNDENMQNIIDGKENVISLLHELQKYRNLSTLDEFEEWLYDRDNRLGAAQMVIDNLKSEHGL